MTSDIILLNAGLSPRRKFIYPMAPGVEEINPVATTNDLSMNVYQMGSMHLDNVSRDENLTFRKFVRKSVELIGVVLTDERLAGKSGSFSADNRAIALGTLCIEDRKTDLQELRRIMCSDLPSLPASFTFLSKEGWPIHKQQELQIKASHVINDNKCICIKSGFDKPRVGVVTSSGDPVGFVFTDFNVNIKELRDIIEQQLKISQQRLDYRFVERNGWPVMLSQEAVLSLTDVLLGQIVRIQNGERLTSSYYMPSPSEPTRPTSIHLPGGNAVVENRLLPSLTNPPEIPEHEPVKRKKSLKFFTRNDTQISMKIRKDSEKRPRLGKENLVKPILISYVRAEAAQYALDLKRELVLMGFSVYLDVHEIKTGSDWQDALNFAVTHCFMFVPLITPMYGKTQWTNREIKLADVLGKLIIPVNFMENWPPACLAIQFASTQYIPWKLQDADHVKGDCEKISNARAWDPVCVKRVGKQVAESYKEHVHKLPKRNLSGKEVMFSSLRAPPSGKEDCNAYYKDDVFEDNKQSIVISAHPRQRYLADDLKSTFEKAGHEVWCSVELLGAQETLCSEELALTPRNLPTIREGGVFFSQNDDIFSSIGEKRSLSMQRESDTYGRRPLSRLISQFSDISQPSTLSHERLDHLRTFQQKVDQAAVVIVLVSEAYTKSTFSHQQVFYCEHRKRVVLVRCDTVPVPQWFRQLMGNNMIMKVNNPQFDCVLKSTVARALNPTAKEPLKDATGEAKMNCLVNFLKRNLPLQDMCVYVAGSSKLQTHRAEEICKAIGAELAKEERVSIVTGGFFGAADITAKTFYECRENNLYKEDLSVIHILPMHDPEDLTTKSRQNPDGSFEAVPYGKNFFLGDTVKERETVVARLLDTCLVIEGGPGVVHEVQEFIWNDHFVIPIMSTGGAAGGQYGVPVKIFELPPGVDVADWSVLSDKDATPETVAKAVVNIMISLKRELASASPAVTLQKSAAVLLKRKSRRKLKSRKVKEQQQQEDDMHELDLVVPHHSALPLNTMRGVFDIMGEVSEISQSSGSDSDIKRKLSWWQRFLKVFKHRN